MCRGHRSEVSLDKGQFHSPHATFFLSTSICLRLSSQNSTPLLRCPCIQKRPINYRLFAVPLDVDILIRRMSLTYSHMGIDLVHTHDWTMAEGQSFLSHGHVSPRLDNQTVVRSTPHVDGILSVANSYQFLLGA